MDLDRLQKSSAGNGLLRLQVSIFVAILGFVMLAPRPGSAILLLPLVVNGETATLEWEISRGAAIAGKGPAGSIVLVRAHQGIGLRAIKDGVLAIQIPQLLCNETSNARWTT